MTTIHFEFDKYHLTEEARDIMAGNAMALEEYPNAIIRIEGHCDERGSDEYNMALGEKRAATARDYLTNYGIPADVISIISYGESRPVDPGHNEGAWAKNRRAEFIKVSE
jgi:peptidoglycan-associated lipoprotein